MPIHQEVTLEAAPERVYRLLTDEAQFAAATGRTAKIDATEGGAFSIFGGYIQGREIELAPGKRIVQSWRGSDWAPGAHSLVRLTLTPARSGPRRELGRAFADRNRRLYLRMWNGRYECRLG